MTTRQSIDDFLGLKRVAVVGVSRKPGDFSRAVFRELRTRGYDVVPVNPGVFEVEGQRCFARLQDVAPPVEGALLLTAPAITEAVVRDCAEAGVHSVWMARGAVSRPAIEFCRAKAIPVIPGECPFMFLSHTGFIHRAHGFVRQIVGTYPH